MTMKHTHEAGRSMIEMLGVLAIIGVLSVGGIAGYSQAMSKYKVTKTTDQIQTMVTNIRTLFAGQRTYGGLETAKTAYTMGIYTDETYPGSGSTGSNAYGGDINLTVSANGRNFAISYNNIPNDACVRIVMSDWGDASSGLDGLVVEANTGTSDADVKASSITFSTVNHGKSGGFPVGLAAAVDACDNDDLNRITWVYR